MRTHSFWLTLPIIALLGACSLMPPKTFPTADHVDLDRYMGAWYVIAHIPPNATAHAYNAVERYQRIGPAKIHTLFTYRDGGFHAPMKAIQSTGFVLNGSGNAVWGEQFFWPLKLQYVISYIGDDYDTTIVARDKRDWVWIMARTPKISDAKLQSLVTRVKKLGYDTSKLRMVPQRPLAKRQAE